MRHRLYIVFLLILFLPVKTVQAQSVSRILQSFQVFRESAQKGLESTEMYDNLFDCYSECKILLENSSLNAESYTRIKNMLRMMHPYMERGAYYNSSSNNQGKALAFTMAYIDLPLMNMFRGEDFSLSSHYADLVYFAGSNSYNAGNYQKASIYLYEYIKTGDLSKRKDVLKFLLQACANTKDMSMLHQTMQIVLKEMPSEFNLFAIAIQCCIDNNEYSNVQIYLDRAMSLNSSDRNLLYAQGIVYEENRNYSNAIQVFSRLNTMQPNNLTYTKHLGLNYYNCAVKSYNEFLDTKSEAEKSKPQKNFKEYFQAAIQVLEGVVNAEPMSLKYLMALASSYACIGDEQRLNTMNERIISQGGTIVNEFNPNFLTYKGEVSIVSDNNIPFDSAIRVEDANEDIPDYVTYAQSYVRKEYEKWIVRDEFETVEDYRKRTSKEACERKSSELNSAATRLYINNYGGRCKKEDFELNPYDPDHESYLIKSKWGDLVLGVPNNGEARIFKRDWARIQLKDRDFYVNEDNKLVLSHLSFTTPEGKSYVYDIQDNATYIKSKFVVDISDLTIVAQGKTKHQKNEGEVMIKETTYSSVSDVDNDIPVNEPVNEGTFAVIIANEDYSGLDIAKVDYALNDGRSFAEYCNKVLGLPEKNILTCYNAGFANMIEVIQKLKNIVETHAGCNVMFYYSGHGFPAEDTKDAYLLPIGSNPSYLQTCYRLGDLYDELGEMPSSSVICMLDACFCGATRNEADLFKGQRGVRISTKSTPVKGNLVIFSAATDKQTASSYDEQQHGMFTYFMLKKIKETAGDVTLKELSDYVITHVKEVSSFKKIQTPTIQWSDALSEKWDKLKLVPHIVKK